MNPSTIWILAQAFAVFVVTRNLLFWYPIWKHHPDSTAAWDRYRTEWVRLAFASVGLLIGVLSFVLTVDRFGWDEAFAWTLYPDPTGQREFEWTARVITEQVILWGIILYGQGWTTVSILTRRLWDRVGDNYPPPSTTQIDATARKTAAALKIITQEDAAQIKVEFDTAVTEIKELIEQTKQQAKGAFEEANHVNNKIEDLNKRLLSVIAADKNTVDRIDETTLDTQKTTASTDELLREKLDTIADNMETQSKALEDQGKE